MSTPASTTADNPPITARTTPTATNETHAHHTAHPSFSPNRTLRISTRSSALAIAQVDLFESLLHTHPSPAVNLTPTTIHPIHTSLGDTNKTTDLHTLASTGKSLWTEDLEAELLAGRVDVIVHSMKDVPTKLPAGCVCAAVGSREESRDCIVLNPKYHAEWSAARKRGGDGLGSGLEVLPEGGAVGTSSVRRAAMIRRRYPHLVIQDMRGNVGTRLKKLDDAEMGFDAACIAGAGVQRLGMGERIHGWLDGRNGVLHSVGQGAIGVEWREGDEWVGGLVAALSGVGTRERRVRWECVAERGLLRVLEGGCSVPLGVQCDWEEDGAPLTHIKSGEVEEGGDGRNGEKLKKTERMEGETEYGAILVMQAMVVSVDGKQSIEGTRRHKVASDAGGGGMWVADGPGIGGERCRGDLEGDCAEQEDDRRTGRCLKPDGGDNNRLPIWLCSQTVRSSRCKKQRSKSAWLHEKTDNTLLRYQLRARICV